MLINIVEPIVQLLGIGLTVSGSSSLSAESNLISNATVINTPVLLTAESNLQTNAVVVLNVSSTLTAQSNLSSSVVLGFVGSSSLTFQTNLTVQSNIVSIVVSLNSGESNLTATSSLVEYVSINLSSNSNLDFSPLFLINLESRPLSSNSILSATMFQPLKILNLPNVKYQASKDRLLRFYTLDTEQSLVINGTTGKFVRFYTDIEIDEADYYFGGGRKHVLNDTEITAVTNAGFSNLITIEGVPSGV